MNHEAGLCECPVLRFAAESERLAQSGIVPSGDDYSLRIRIGAIVAGIARAESKCTGPKNGNCPFYSSLHISGLTTDPSVPLLKRRTAASPETGQML